MRTAGKDQPHRQQPRVGANVGLSYTCRKILNDLSSEEAAHAEGKNSPASTGVTVPSTSIYQTSTGQYSKTLCLP